MGSKEGDNDLDYRINGDTKGMEEVNELFIESLSSSTTDIV